MVQVLIIDDDKEVAEMLHRMVSRRGHHPQVARTLAEGLEEAYAASYDAVFLDVRLPDGNGLDILPQLLDLKPAPEVIIMTGFGDPDGAEIAIQSGAWDYVQKPLSYHQVTLALNQVLQYRKNLKERQEPANLLKIDGIVGSSRQLTACLDVVARAAQSEADVLIAGETGTGKELFARAIHLNSRRALKNLVVVDCAALPETLIESALFGHEKGAFTGAEKAKTGLIKQADGGTLFLDEIGELPLSMQKTFLRVLQERTFRPVGSTSETRSDFRLIAATNRDLEQMVADGLFRKDLLFRIRAIAIHLPPLRSRCEDINALVGFHLQKLCRNYRIAEKKVSPDFMEALMHYSWPGNVRELANTLDMVIALAKDEAVLFAKHLPINIRVNYTRFQVKGKGRDGQPRETDGPGLAASPAESTFRAFREAALLQAERSYLQDLMRITKGKINDACRTSGLGRTQLYLLLKKHNICRLGWSTEAAE